MSKILEIQLRLNLHYEASRSNNPFVRVLGFDAKLGLNIFPYHINNYQPATKRHNATFQAFTNAKDRQAKQANVHRTLKPQHKVGDKVLLSTKNMNIKNISYKMQPLWIGPFTILSANYNPNNYSLDLSSNLSQHLTRNTFHVSKIKPPRNNNSILFPQAQLKIPGPVPQDRYDIEKGMEYGKATRTGITQSKVRWVRYSFEDNQLINAKVISSETLQDF